MTMANNIKERIYKFDNIKFLTIVLVVVGHVIEPYVDKSDMFKSLFVFIYSFHMPLFIFISGLLQKRYSDTNKLKINKIAFFVVLGFALKFINAFSKYLAGKSFSVNFFGGSSIDWYMFVMAMFMVTAYLLRKVHPAIVLSVVFIAGCTSGYFNFIDDTLYLSRFIVFLPVYMLGYYMTPELLIKIEKNLVVKLLSGVAMLTFFVLSFRCLDVVYKLRKLFTGKNPFDSIPIDGCGFEHRLLCYAISLTLCMAVFCFIPNIKMPFVSKMGANTLAVYIFHMPLLNLIRATGLFDMIISLGDPLYKIILLSFGVIFAFVLSFGIFMVPLKWVSKGIDKLKPCWCYTLIFAPFAIGLATMYKELPGYIGYLFDRIKNIFT